MKAPVTRPDRVAKPLVGVDHVECAPDGTGGLDVRARKRVDAGDPYQRGHFPGLPIYPGLFLLETLYQATTAALGREEDRPLRIHAVRSLRCLNPVPAGSTLRITARVHPESESGLRRVTARCFCDGNLRVATLSIDLGAGWDDCVATPVADVPPTGGHLEHAEVRSLLPHGWPVMLLDRVVDHIPGSTLSAVKAVSAGEPCYADVPSAAPRSHYAYPTSLLLESFGQAAAVLWLLSTGGNDAGPGELLMFALAYDCVIHRAAVPGDVLRHEVRLDQTRTGMAFASGQTRVGEEPIATIGSFGAVIRPLDEVPVLAAPDGHATAREGAKE